jgi:hypothetical protein
MARSEMQWQILRFSREVWKYVYKCPEPIKSQLAIYVRKEFLAYKDLPRLKFHQIEYRLRSGKNRFAMIKNSGQIDNISHF